MFWLSLWLLQKYSLKLRLAKKSYRNYYVLGLLAILTFLRLFIACITIMES
jgi:hypothetical protein